MLEAPVLSSPADAATNIGINPTLSWNSVTNATSYTLQYSTSASFATNTQSVTTSLSSNISGLSYNTTYYWRVKAFDGTAFSAWSAVRSFTTEQLVLSAPVLSSPADASTGISLSPSLSWGTVTNATGYTIQYATASDFSTNTQSTSTATSQSLTGLSSLTTYYWRVKATNGGIESSWSSVYSFTTLEQTLDAPVLVSPADAATNIAVNPSLTWNTVTGATSYVVQYSTSNDFSAYTQSSATATSLTVSGLSYNTTYYWRVKAYDGTIYSNWSSVYAFTTLQLTLSAPTLLSPSNNATGISATPSLSWNSVADATGYTVQYSTSSNFTTYSQVTSSTSSVALSGLSYTTAYYWRVKATNGGIESGWSSVWGFTTQSMTLTVPTLDLPRNNSRNIPTTTDLSWYSVTNATGYDVEYSTSSIFSTSTIVSAANLNATISGLSLNTTYYWRARAKANNVNGGWSASRKFKTIMAKPGFGNGDLISNDEDLRITPNPAKDKVDFIFYVLDAGNADISLFDLKGNKVMNIANGDYNEGVNVVSRNLVNLSSGVYVVVLKSEGLTVSENITIIK